VLCRPYSTGILLSVSDQMQHLPNYFTTPTKMTSENDIKGLVSLKFLRPWELVLKRSCYNTMDLETPPTENGIWLTQQMCYTINGTTNKGKSTQNVVFLSCSGNILVFL
jgi:hypothetical protein